jgi:hypothetical protein
VVVAVDVFSDGERFHLQGYINMQNEYELWAINPALAL